MTVLTRRERLELILTYYILWKIQKEPRVIRKIIRHLHAPARSFNASDLSVASLADLGTRNHIDLQNVTANQHHTPPTSISDLATKDHDLLDGLLDDDHTQYLPLTCVRDLTGDLSFDAKTRKIEWSATAYIEGQDHAGADGLTLYGPDVIRLEGNMWCNGQALFDSFFYMRSTVAKQFYSACNPLYFRQLDTGSNWQTLITFNKAGAGACNADINQAGEITFIAKGLPFGTISVIGNLNNTVIPGAGGAVNKAQLTEFDTDNAEHNTDADHTNDHIKITKAGTYLITLSCCIESIVAGGGDNIHVEIWKNNGATFLDGLFAHHLLQGGGGDMECLSIQGIATGLAVDDTIEVWITNVDSGDDLLFRHATLSVVQIGG